jgi:competence protein ComEC
VTRPGDGPAAGRARRPGSAPASVAAAVGASLAALVVRATSVEIGPAQAAAALVALGATAYLCWRAVGRGRGLGRRPAHRGRARAIGLAGLGMAAIGLRILVASVLSGPDLATALPAGDGPWVGVVEAIGSPRNGQQLATVSIDAAGGLRVAATLPRYPSVGPGDAVTIRGGLEAPRDDDYGAHLRSSGIAATLRASTLERTGLAPGPDSQLEEGRRAAADGLARVMPEPEAGLAAGILIGLRDRVDRELAAAFTSAGVSHVIAISGWNIAIVAGLVAAVLRRRMGRRARSAITIGAIVAYTVAAGASPSVVRAAAMAAIVLTARESGRAGRATTALGLAVVGLLLLEPATIADPGFGLSVLATAGLLAWSGPIAERLGRFGGGRLPGWLVESLAVSFAAEAATLPLVLLVFGRLALIAPAVNLVVVPLVPPAMAAGAVALLAGAGVGLGLPSIVGTIAALPGWIFLALMVAVVRGAASLPLASATLEPPWNVAAALVTAGIVAGLATGVPALVRRAWRRRLRVPGTAGSARSRRVVPASPGRTTIDQPRGPRRTTGSDRTIRVVARALALAVGAVGIAAAHRPNGTVRVVVLDVGQGDAILVEGGLGGRLLVDGGPDPGRLLVALDAELPPWDRRVDVVVLTHPHEDHVAGLPLLLERYRVGRVFEPGTRGPGPGYRAWRAALDRLGLHPERLATGDRLAIDGIRLRVLWPDADAVPLEPADGGTAINNVSIVLLGETDRGRFLLAGDIEEEIDPRLIARGLPRVDLLKVAHHGSRTSSTAAFLDAVRPRAAIVSVGTGNPYGHPAPATLARIALRGAALFRTDLNGTVEATFGDRGLEIRGDRGGGASAERTTAPSTGGTTPNGGLTRYACAIARLTLASPGATRLAVAAPALATPGPAQAATDPGGDPYHRLDVRSLPGRRGGDPPLARPAALGAPARPRGRRGGGLAGRPDRRVRPAGRPRAGRGGGTPPRRRQAPPARRSRQLAAARGGLEGVAGPTRPP